MSQPPKGTGTGTNVLTLNYTTVSNSIVTVTIPAVGAYIQGNVIIDPASSFNIGTTQQGNIYNTMYIEGTTTAGFTPATPPITVSSTTLGTLSRLTINGLPASLLQTQLSQFDQSVGAYGQELRNFDRRICLSNSSCHGRSTTTRHAAGIASRVPGHFLPDHQLVIPLVRCMNAVSRLISSSLKRVSS